MKQQTQNNQKGFTLIELMIVIAIIGILAAIAIPNYISYRDKGFCSATESDANALSSGLADYFAIPGNVAVVAVGPTNLVNYNGNGTIKLSGVNQGTLTPVAGGHYTIVVTDGSNRCPLVYQVGNTKWANALGGPYTITM